jgi:flagellar motor switch protein FliG
MAEGLREEIEDSGKVKAKDGEEAMTEMVNVIRALAANGEILLVTGDEDDE